MLFALTTPAPMVAHCELETTQRAYFRVENVPGNAVGVGVRLRFYDARKKWLGDELLFGSPEGNSVPIPRLAGLFDPQKAASVTCSVDGYASLGDQLGFIGTQPASASGRKACPEDNGVIVDGGPDSAIDWVIAGRDWFMATYSVFVNHFFHNQETQLSGDEFVSTLDGGSEQKYVVSGQDPQYVSVLYTGLRPGFHQLDYGPWSGFDAVRLGGSGYHNFCLRLPSSF